MSTTNAQMQARWNAVMQNNYSTPSVALARGVGADVWDVEGNHYIDLLAGIATNLLGHAHPDVVAAVGDQVSRLGHVSNFFAHEPGLALAEQLSQMSGGGKVYFCNSGAEANEAAFKLSRLTGRTQVVAATASFHGRTMGALALTGQPSKSDPFQPLPGGVTHVSFGDLDALAGAVTEQTAMVILEPIQGEAGVVTPPAGYLQGARAITKNVGALLAVDEVQTGMGRTGRWFAYQYEIDDPDIITMAKGLGAGLPMGAMIARGPAAELLHGGSHGSTFGGNPIAAAASLAAIEVIKRDGLLDRAVELGDGLNEAITNLDSPLVAGVRGRGLLRGVVLSAEIAGRIQQSVLTAGFLTNAASPNVLRLAPPLTIERGQLDLFVDALAAALKEAQA
jgi:acetylornithine/N-succinyldiaminopimelate aminotransferase